MAGITGLPPGGQETSWDGVMAYDNDEPAMVKGRFFQVDDEEQVDQHHGLAKVRTLTVDPHLPDNRVVITRPEPPPGAARPMGSNATSRRARAADEIRATGALGHRQIPQSEQSGVVAMSQPPQARRPAFQQSSHARPPQTLPPRVQPAAPKQAPRVPSPAFVLSFDLTPGVDVEHQQDPIDQAYHKYEFDEDRHLLLYSDRRFSEVSGMRCWFPRCPSKNVIVVHVPQAGAIYARAVMKLVVDHYDVCVLDVLDDPNPGPDAPASFDAMSAPPTWPTQTDPADLHAYQEAGDATAPAAAAADDSSMNEGILGGSDSDQASDHQDWPHTTGGNGRAG